MRVAWILLLAAALAPAQERKTGLTEAEKKEVFALAADYLAAKSWEDKQAVAKKLEAFRPGKAALAAIRNRLGPPFRKGPLHNGRSPAKCSNPAYPGQYLITVPGGARRGEKVGLFISLHGGGAGGGGGAPRPGPFRRP